jgi:predicted DsbA family dithiol-disulfide isomerase
MPVKNELLIEVVSDVVCPWCFIGKRRLEKALSLLGRPAAQVRWKAFQLNPDAPKEGMNRQAYRVRKFGSLAYSQQLEARVADAGMEDGIEFRFDRIERTPNTFDAHRLIWLAGREGCAGCGCRKSVSSLFYRCRRCGEPRRPDANRNRERPRRRQRGEIAERRSRRKRGSRR